MQKLLKMVEGRQTHAISIQVTEEGFEGLSQTGENCAQTNSEALRHCSPDVPIGQDQSFGHIRRQNKSLQASSTPVGQVSQRRKETLRSEALCTVPWKESRMSWGRHK